MINPVEIRSRELATLCQRHRVKSLALFGSAVRNDFDLEKNDLDFAVEFSVLSPEEHAAAYFGLLEDLETLFERRVDLVKNEAVRNPYQRRSIEEEQETIYAAA